MKRRAPVLAWSCHPASVLGFQEEINRATGVVMPQQSTEIEVANRLAIEEAIQHVLSLKIPGENLREIPRIPYPKVIQVTRDNRTDICPAKDISTGGVGFLHTSPVYGRIIVGISTSDGEHYRILAEIVRARQVGRFYEMGAKFVERVA